MAMSDNQDEGSGIESSQEEVISPIMSQETYQLLESDLPISNFVYQVQSESDVPAEECDITVCASQTDREFTKITPRGKSGPERSSNQVEQPSSSELSPANVVDHSRFNNIEGPFKFGIHFNETNEPIPKNAPWTFSPQLKKLFVNFNVACPLQIRFQREPPPGCVIRATPYFKDAQDANFDVKRCLTHQRLTDTSNIGFQDKVEHVIRCDSSGVEYQRNPTNGRLSVVAPYRGPEAHLGLTTLNYYFTCFNSCTGGMNRRAIYVVYTLELANEILGQRYFEVRICACPGRDRSKCEKKSTKRLERDRQALLQDLKRPSEEEGEMPPPKVPKTRNDDDSHMVSISFPVNGKENRDTYQRILQSIKDSAAYLAPTLFSVNRGIKREVEDD